MKIYLAPMEGVVNARMRALLTSIGGLDRCVTEFVRVTSAGIGESHVHDVSITKEAPNYPVSGG